MNDSGMRPLVRRPVSGALLDGVDPVLARLYGARGIREVSELNYGLGGLAPVGSLQNIDNGVDLLRRFRDRRITVIGDFDADGATSTALVLRCLREFGFRDVDYLVPNRFDFGYGLTPEIVDVAAKRGPDLLITVDNGISSVDGVDRATQLGIEVLITDHHLPGTVLPRRSGDDKSKPWRVANLRARTLPASALRSI